VTLARARRPIFFSGLLLCMVALTLMLVWAFSRPHRPLEYMVAGTLSTALVLLGVFLVIVKRRMI
jgi:quinol-cytochrome oxidoreductase complex cytochrome b subunit